MHFKKAALVAATLLITSFFIIGFRLPNTILLKDGGGWYYQTVTENINNDGDKFEVLDVLAKEVGILGIFSDWPASVTFYANCMNL